MKSMNQRQRFEFLKKNNFTCNYCGRKPPEVVLEIDHITSKASGGKDSIENYCVACRECNGGKNNTPLHNYELKKSLGSNYKKEATRFTSKIRIDPKQLQWLKENKDTKTLAGFLDKLINDEKRRNSTRQESFIQSL